MRFSDTYAILMPEKLFNQFNNFAKKSKACVKKTDSAREIPRGLRDSPVVYTSFGGSGTPTIGKSNSTQSTRKSLPCWMPAPLVVMALPKWPAPSW